MKFSISALILLTASAASAAEPEDLLGKWETLQPALGLPARTIWEFRKDGELQLAVNNKSIALKYEVKESALIIFIKGMKDTTEIVSVSKSELILKDGDGATIRMKKAP